MELFGNASGEGELAVSIVGYLQTHYMDTSLEEVAKKFHYSVSHVNRILKKYTGTTVLKYVRYLKIHHACELLAKTNYTVEEISNYAGYADTSYFIEQFRKEMQTTPLKYRKKIMEK
jgi:AraC-like DNA-binding protein